MEYVTIEFRPCSHYIQCQHLFQKADKGLASFSNSPDNEVCRQIFGHGETLQCHILRYLCKQIAKVENRRQPVVLVGGQVRIVNDAEDGRVAELHISSAGKHLLAK